MAVGLIALGLLVGSGAVQLGGMMPCDRKALGEALRAGRLGTLAGPPRDPRQ